MALRVQRYQRTKMVLPLRLWLDVENDDAAGLQLAYTVDISPIGGRLGGLRKKLNPGQKILLQRGQQRTPFRVIWNNELAPGEHQAGIETLEFGKNIWGIDLPQSAVRRVPPEAAPADKDSPRVRQSSQVWAALASRFAQISPALLDSRVRWSLGVGILAVGGLMGGLIYGQLFRQSGMDVRPPQPVPPSLEVSWIAAKTPPALKDEISTWHLNPVPRIEVSEAPTKHMVYPVSPDVKMSGKVDLNVVIGTDGRVKQIQVLSGRQPLAGAAEQAVRQWRYNPYQVKGEPAEGKANVVVGFRGADAVSLEFPTSTSAAN